MAKKSKVETEKQADASADPEAKTTGVASKPKRKKVASKKKSAPKKIPSSASIHEPSDDEIRIRAYFIAERRIQLSLEGDSAHDWIEARRQLVEEANRTAS